MLKFIGFYVVIFVVIGLIELFMILNLVDEFIEIRGSFNCECLVQGGVNIVMGFFGGMGGCVMIGQLIINIKFGGCMCLFGIVVVVILFGFIFFVFSIIEQVFIGVLVGVMFMVVIGIFVWSSFCILNKILVSDVLVLVSVFVFMVVFDFVIVVVVGIIMSVFVFVWENVKCICVCKCFFDDGIKVYEIWGFLFFGSIQVFKSKFDVNNDFENIIIDFMELWVSDYLVLEVFF